jgi:hypothetical protein
VFVLLYAAFGADRILDQLLSRVRDTARGRAKLAAISVLAVVIAISRVPDATRFVGAAAGELDFRVPYEVARRLRSAPHSSRILTLGDNYVDRLVIATYTGIPLDRIEPVAVYLPPDATHVVDIQRPNAVSSVAVQEVRRRLADGEIRADPVRIPSAIIWTLPSPERPTD